MTARYRAVLAYDGTSYCGFQRQAGTTPTIQGAVEAALARVTQQQIALIGAGRTDSGVHATGQVIAFDAEWRHAPQDLWRAVNANLPDSIVLQSLTGAEAGFHPRYDARSRVYEYSLYVAPVRHPLLNTYAWHVSTARTLDMDAMRAAAEILVGTHDFAAFGRPPQGEITIRKVMRSEFSMMSGSMSGARMIRYRIEANAFLYRMVRRIVGALVQVGQGRISLETFEAVLRAADGSWPHQKMAPPHGLCLVEVTY